MGDEVGGARAGRQVRVRSPRPQRLIALLERHGFSVEPVDAHELRVEGSTGEEVALLAGFFHVPLHHVCEEEP